MLPHVWAIPFNSGRGLGSAAVHGIVRAHRGVIEVSRESGRGTVMRILLPAARPAREEGVAHPVSVEVPEESDRPGAILVVDDEESVVQVINRMLELQGYDVLTASSEQQVIDRARNDGSGVRAILFDFTLPEGDPCETLREIRTSGLEAPVIMMSGFSREQVMERVGEDGVAGFLEKPFGSRVLLSELERVLEQ